MPENHKYKKGRNRHSGALTSASIQVAQGSGCVKLDVYTD